METLRSCIFSFCVACVVIGIMERLAMSRRRFSVIKLVGTLYILATVFLPLQRLPAMQWTPEIPSAPSITDVPDTAQLALTAAEQALAGQIERALDAASIPFHTAEVLLEEQDGTVQLCRVIVTVPAGTDTQAAAQAAAQIMGAQVQVEVREEGT